MYICCHAAILYPVYLIFTLQFFWLAIENPLANENHVYKNPLEHLFLKMAAEAEDDLDYHITFPSPVPQDGDEDAIEETAISPERQEPVVLLLGWAGALDKHLAKYISIYERRCSLVSSFALWPVT